MPKLYFPSLARGANKSLPPGMATNTQDQRLPLWVTLHNMRPHDGGLIRRPATVNVAGGPTLDSAHAQTVIHLEELYSGPKGSGGANKFLLVTNREMWIGEPGGWANITPVYTDGTVSVTNGSPTVTGAGTLWDTRRIAATQLIQLPDTNWYVIQSVDSDTQVTLTTNYAGGTLGAQPYTIRRTFLIEASPSSYGGHAVFTTRINADLYVAGALGAGRIPLVPTTLADGAVIAIYGAFNEVGTPAASYVTSGEGTLNTGLDNLGYFTFLLGMETLPDGRLILAIHQITSTIESGDNRIVFSSHLAGGTAVWTSTPAGFSDLVDHEKPITGLSRVANSYLAHFEDGVEIGQLTGKADEPLRWAPSRALKGMVGPLMNQSVPGGAAIPAGDLYLSSDSKLYLFDGYSNRPVIPEAWRFFAKDRLEGPQGLGCLRQGFSLYDSHRNEVVFFVRDFPSNSDTKTIAVHIPLDNTQPWVSEYSPPVYAALSPTAYFFREQKVWGAYSRLNETMVLGTGNTDGWFFSLDETVFRDHASLGTADGVYALMDVAHPESPDQTLMVREVLLWVRANPFTPNTTNLSEPVKVSIEWDDGTSETLSVTPSVILSGPTKTDYWHPESVLVFSGFEEKPSTTVRIRILAEDDDNFPYQLTRAMLDYAETGDVRTR